MARSSPKGACGVFGGKELVEMRDGCGFPSTDKGVVSDQDARLRLGLRVNFSLTSTVLVVFGMCHRYPVDGAITKNMNLLCDYLYGICSPSQSEPPYSMSNQHHPGIRNC